MTRQQGRSKAAEVVARLGALPLHTFEIVAGGRRWSIEAVRDQDALLQSADLFVAFPYGLLLWDSAVALADELAGLGSLAAIRVLELGAGVGLAGLAARAQGAEVVQTDHGPEALELCRRNAARNGLDGIITHMGDWDRWDDASQYDLIIGSDILYDVAAHAPVLAILKRNLKPGGTAILSDPCRPLTPGFVTLLEASLFATSQHTRRVAAVHPLQPGHAVDISMIFVRRRSATAGRDVSAAADRG